MLIPVKKLIYAFYWSLLVILIFFSGDLGAQIQKGGDIDGEAGFDFSGWSVSMPDINTVGIGAYNNGPSSVAHGHARIYKWTGSAWVQKGGDIDGEANGDRSGQSVSMPDSNTIAIGAHYNSGNGNKAGHTRIYKWNGTSWVQRGADIDGEAALDYSGFTVSMPDSNTVAIGAYGNDGSAGDAGHVRIYNWNGSAWVQKGGDIDGESVNDFSGYSVSMPDPNTVAIGAYANDGSAGDAGHARVYRWSGTAWVQKGGDIDGEAANDYSGFTVSMPDSNTIAIGAYGNDDNGTDAGHARVYRWNGTTWVQKGSDIDGEAANDVSGYSVSMPNANTIAIGASSNDDNGNDAGQTRVYGWNTSTSSWVQIQSDIDGESAGNLSGYSVSMPSPDVVAIGAPRNSPSTSNQGHVRVYKLCNNTTSSISKSVCDKFISPSGKYTLTTSGTYSDTIANAAGCDSIISINLTILTNPIAKIYNTSLDSCLNSSWSFKVDDLAAATIKNIEWIFPTTTSLTDSLVNYSFTNNGSNRVEVRITNADLCLDTTSIMVNVYDNPVAGFTINDSTQCIDNHRFRLTNTSTYQTSSVSYDWDFGDSSNSSSRNPVKIYDYTGYKNIQLITRDTRGCADTITQQAFVAPYPISDFTINDTLQCENHNVFVFEDASTILTGGGSLSSAWEYGDGTSSTGDSVTHNYASTTSYITVIHKSISSYGCTDSSTKIVHVRKGPSANFNIDTILFCIRGNEFGFTDASVAGDGTNDTYVWTWGDTQKDTFTTATRKTYSYGDTGLYAIQLWVRDNNGCYDSASKSTQVHPNPSAQFAVVDSLQCLDINSFGFTQQSVSGSPNTSLTYAWDFVDTSSTDASPLIGYATTGTRNIKLIVSNIFSCKDTFNSVLRVYALPNPSFAINDSTQCENDHQFVYTNGSNIGAGEGTLSYAWNLGDGSTSAQENITKGYSGFDTVAVKLVVSSSFGCKDSISKRVEILQKPQTELVRMFTDSCLDSKVKLKVIDREVSVPNSVSWLYSNGFTSTDSISETSYTTEGSKSMRVIVGNSRGCLDTLNYNFNLYNNPIAGFYAVDSALCFRGNEFEWKDSSNLQYGTAINYVWHFGDGASDTSTNKNSIKHTYADTGMYEVQLQITNSLGCADTTGRKIRVDYHPVTQITKVNTDSCLNNASYFKVDDLLAATIPNILWTFSDASTYTDSSIQKKFASSGVQTIETIISNIYGCADTAEFKFKIYDNPVASFSIADTFDCVKGNEFDFQSTSTTTYGNLNTYDWNFGDNSTAGSGSSTKYSYSDSGTYTVRLIVTNSLGCADSIQRLVRVNPNPRAYFNADIYLQCLNGNSTQFTDSSESNLVNSSLQYAWDFGDTTTSVTTNPSKTYTYFGVKTITAIVTNTEMCPDTIIRNVEIKPEPIARNSIADAAQCENDNLFTFTDTTIIPPRGGSHWVRWLVNEIEIGDSTTVQNYSVDSAKSYTLKMISESEFGCKDSIEKPFRVLPKPIAKIVYSSPDSCLTTTAKFTAINTAGNGIKNASWLFSDSTKATGVNTSKKYSSAGLKWVELILENTNGCFDTSRFEFNVHQNPVAQFIVGSYSQCLLGNTFKFIDSSKAIVGNLDSIRWNYADGTIKRTTAGTSNYYSYQTARTYRVRLNVYNSYACQDSTDKNVIVRANPTADFDINNNNQCLNINAFTLTNISSPNNGNSNMSFTWEFGDSSNSSSRNVTKSYAYDGTKNIRLITSNSDGCLDTIEKTVTVRSMPSADFSINTVNQCVNQNAYNFSDISTIKSGGGTLSRIWNLGDGSVSNQKNISNKNYTNAQNFDVQLISRNNFNCADTLIKTISVLPKPKANFTVNLDTQCLVNNNYSLNNQTSIVSGGGTLSYDWSYGDGNSSTNTHSDHSYKNYGTYKIKLTATSQYGCVDSLSLPVKVVANPLVDFSFVNADKQCNSVDTFRLQNKTDKRNAFSISYLWNFGDGTTSTNTQASKSYSGAGDYRITLYAENNNGCKDSVNYSAKVYPDPETDFSINQVGQCINNQKFDFTNNTSVSYGGGSLTYQWFYSDTLFDTNTNSTKTFDEVKTYSIKLIASSSLGCKDSTNKNIVLYPKPSASFDINDTAQCLTNNVFKLTNNSRVSSGTNSYQWDFGDNTGNSVVSPDKVFTKSGTYTIQLLALTNNGCRDSVSRKAIVHSQPIISFSRSDTALCKYQNSFTFTNNSSNADASKLSYLWKYSDGNSDTVTSPTIGFKESGLYLVKLVGRTAFGCLDSQIQSVRVFPQPLPSFTIKSPFQCLTNNSYDATNYSSIASEGGTLSYRWEFGDGNSSTSVNPTWKYVNDDTFEVRMYVESTLGCHDSLFKSVIVYPQPVVGFTISDSSQCLGTNQFSFKNTSKVTYGSLRYDWTFGDGGRSIGVNPLVKYNSEGTYKVALFAATNFGCKDSAFVNVRVHPDPQALFDINDENQCFRGNKFELKNKTTLSAGTFNSAWDFGDFNTSISQDPKHIYSDDGIYVIRLTVTTAQSCIDSTYKIIQVYPQPSANFTINDSVQCINDNDFIFENKSVVNFGGLRSFWDFGDVNYSSNETGRHTYSKSGVFDVQLVSFTAFACSDTISQEVRITEIPQIAFTLDTSILCERGNEFRATNNSTYNGAEKIDYNWKSSDDYNVFSINFQHRYAERGTYELKLVGRSSEGCMDSSMQTLTVYPQGESKIVVIDSVQCLFGNDFTFGNESKVDGASFSLMSWNFGGVFIDTQLRVTPNKFQFGDTGTFKVTLITTTENLCMDTSAISVRVMKMAVALLEHGALSNCHNEQQFEYIDASEKEPGYTNKWLFNKEVVNNSDTLHPIFELPGKYGITLVVYTEYGCTDTTRSIAISNEVPNARIGVNNNEQCLESNEFLFSNVSTQFNELTAFWDFGDGTLGSGNTIVQDYWDAGEYDVTLVVENDSLCSDTALIKVRVNPTPEAFWYVDSSCMNVPIYMEFTSEIQTGEVVSYLWNMGDGTNYYDSLPSHQYKQSGTHYIILAMRSDKGCFAKFLDSIEVYPDPEAGISFLTERPTILLNNVGFLDSSTDAATREWDFGDGSDLVKDKYEVYHTYRDTGNYQVRLVVASSEGCYDTTSRRLRVWPDFNILLPTAFSPNADGVNDVYHVRGNHHSITTAKWQVYSEDGIKVFESDDIEAGWNGQHMNNGAPLPMGNYQLNLVVKDLYGNQSQFNEKIAIIR